MMNDLRDGSGVCGHNRFAGSHSVPEYDAETLLNTGQAEDVRTIVLLSQFSKRRLPEPPVRDLIQYRSVEAAYNRPASYNTNQVGNYFAQQGGSLDATTPLRPYQVRLTVLKLGYQE